jgi:DNA mismatch repair ATPase MutS
MKHDYDGHEVKFHYILMEGFSERSFAANVARIAGIPN